MDLREIRPDDAAAVQRAVEIGNARMAGGCSRGLQHP
jgi:hypothetical protein